MVTHFIHIQVIDPINMIDRKREFLKEVFRYIVVGVVSVAIDAIIYALLIRWGWSEPQWAKRFSFVVGGIWSFFANKYFTFKQRSVRVQEPFIFAIVVAAGFAINSSIHDLILSYTGIKIWSFLIATGASTIWNYVGQKLIVFRVRNNTKDPS